MTIGYSLVNYRGEHYADGSLKYITLRVKQVMAKLEERLGYNPESLDLEQGCHHDGSLSGSTHLRADVFDLSYNDWSAKAKALMALGVIPFVRQPGWDGKTGGAHMHCILRGSEHLSPEAAAQILDWDAHKDGLAYHRPYDPSLPWGHVKDFVYDPHWTRSDGMSDDGDAAAPRRGKGPWEDAFAAQVAIGLHHNSGLAVVAKLERLIANHPAAHEWAQVQAGFKTIQTRTEDLHTRAYHLAHQGE